MPPMDFDALSLTELIAVQEQVSRSLAQRFQHERALVFVDVVGSTPYFERYGDAAGRVLIQRSQNLLYGVLDTSLGRVVDTAGDGVFLCFETAQAAADTMVAYQRAIDSQNRAFPPEQQLQVRVGLHWGPVLTDGQLVTGDAVNVAARVAGRAGGFEILVSDSAVEALGPRNLRRLRRLQDVTLRGVSSPVRLWEMTWLDTKRFPVRVTVRETKEEHILPMQSVLRFGRLGVWEGEIANEVVLRLPDPQASRKISRWHFELHREDDGYVLLQRSRSPVVVDGEPVPQGGKARIEPFSAVAIADVMTLDFSPRYEAAEGLETIGPA